MARKNIPTETKIEAVLSLLRKEESAKAVARRNGVSDQALFIWRDRFLEEGKKGLEVKASNRDEIKKMSREIEQRDQIIASLTVANHILKKKSEELR